MLTSLRRRASALALDAPEVDARDRDFAWVSVLVVDDNAENREFMSIARFGSQVHQAANGRLALDMLRTWDIDLVLLDIIMPELDGFDVLWQMHADPRLREVPAIVISSVDDSDSMVRGNEMGG